MPSVNRQNGTVTLTGSIVTENTALVYGGGIYNSDNGTVMLIGSIVSENSASGGGSYNDTPAKSMILTLSAICGNTPDQIFGPWTDDGTNLIADNCPPCPSADLNGDSFVDAADLAELLGSWGTCDDCDDCPADFNGDDVIDADDLAILLGAWGPCG